MCAVSAIHDYWRTNTNPAQWTRPMFNEYQEIIKKLDKLDEALGQKDCVDPAKEAWMRDIERRLDEAGL